MELLLANHGSYPRIGDSPGQQRLRRGYAQHERGEITSKEFDAIQTSLIQEIVQEQAEAGLDLVTDGQIRWYDPISHFTGQRDGIKINGLLRSFDTNFYIRQPVVVDQVVWKGPVLVEEYRSAQAVSPKPVKVVVTGPDRAGGVQLRCVSPPTSARPRRSTRPFRRSRSMRSGSISRTAASLAISSHGSAPTRPLPLD